MIGTGIIAAGLTCLLYLSGLFIVWSPLPLVHFWRRYGWRPSFLVLAAASLGMASLYLWVVPAWIRQGSASVPFLALPGLGLQEYFSQAAVTGFGLLYFNYYLLLAVGLILICGRRYSIERTFAFVVSFPLLCSAALLSILLITYRFDLAHELHGYLLYLFGRLADLRESAGLQRTELLWLRDNREAIATQFLHLLPSGLFVATLVTAWCNTVLLRLWFPQYAFFRHWGALSCWRIHDRWIWLAIVSGGAYFIDYYLIGSGGLRVIAANLLVTLASLYFFHGLAIIAFFLQKRSSFLVRALVYSAILLFFQIVGIFIMALGLFDIWLDFRKLTKAKSPSSRA